MNPDRLPGAERVPGTPLLRIENLARQFGGISVLDAERLEVKHGEIHALAGENGAGKSTLVNILAGVLPADSGRILINGIETGIRSVAHARQLGISVIHQDFDLAPNLSIWDNLALGQEQNNRFGFILHARNRRQAADCLQRVGLELDPATLVSELSTAQRQLVAIAAAVSRRCRLLIMDEASSALPAEDVAMLLELARQLSREGVAILFISHKLDEIFEIADRITVLRDGRIIASRATTSTSRHEIISLMVGRELQDLFTRSVRSRGEELLRVEGFSRRGEFSEVGLSLKRAEILGLYGLKGAGRSALARALFGLEPLSGGEVYRSGKRIRLASARDAMHHGIGLLTEDRTRLGLLPNLDLQENLTVAVLDRISRAGFIDRAREQSIALDMLSRLRIRCSGPRQPIGELSGGNQQKVMLARWLALEPEILILDEPTAGVDVGAKSAIYQLIDALAGSGMGILLITSDLPELLGMSDRVLVMHAGKITAEFPAAEATEERIMRTIHA